MVRLTEEMIVARTRVSDMSSVTKLNCWGAELSDISIVRKLKNVQVLSLSVNNIHSLSDIQYCSNLKELYIRKNKIQELSDICWLRGLSSLTNLWLEENPCCASGSYSEQYYRHTVIKALPQLRKLDNVEITPGEMVEAVSVGLELIPPHDRENNGYSSYNGSCNNSKSSPNTNEDNRYYEEDRRQINGYGDSRSHQRMRSSSIEQQQQNSVSPSRRLSNQGYDESISPQISRMRVKHPPEIHQNITNTGSSNSEASDSLRVVKGHHSASVSRASSASNLYNVGKYPSGGLLSSSASSSITNVSRHSTNYNEESRSIVSQHYDQTYHQVNQQIESAQQIISQRQPTPERPYPRRPKNRNSNILSAVLCLIKELDGPSLEVAEMAVRCRMEELED
ncbi:uncharacterized protein [Lepeophtheirus salmonis]|uniref:uncharacterized protein isoform X3 n=1 Tax=Lepeophtheirus salmonis TaxID=72036 RepID=UPI001AE799E8|nr:cilia- and flagella-associated protein 410-like isoform X2 [Lepeophtheirus salmonis]